MECRFHDVYGRSHGRSKLPPEASLELHEWRNALVSHLLEEPDARGLVLDVQHATEVAGYAAGVVEKPHIAVIINPWQRDRAITLIETMARRVVEQQAPAPDSVLLAA